MGFRAVAALLVLAAVSAWGQSEKPSLPPGDSPPPTVFDRVKKAGTAADFDSAGYAIVFDSTVNRVTDLGVAYTDSYVLYKVLTEEGCKSLSVLTRGYEPLSSYTEFRRINIIRGDQAIDVPLTDVRDLPAPQDGIYWSDRLKMVALPRLRVGDGVEAQVFRKGYSYALLEPVGEAPGDERYIPPMRGEYFDIVLFEASVPMVEKKYVLKLPASKRLHSRIYNGPMFSATTYQGDTTVYSWWNKSVAAVKEEDWGPDATDIVTKVVLATVESWEAKSRWFFEVNEPQFQYTDAIKAKVDEILTAAGVANRTDEQKAFELVHWVAQNIRYSGQTMGEGEGYTLHPGAMIFEQRSGVCKDIAGMLITMMRAAGLDSYAAMTMAGSRIEDLPADQFNHCVVALKGPDGGFTMYDPTWVGYYKDIWSKSETEQHYMIGSPKGETLSRIPYSPPAESPLKFTNTARILAEGTLEGTLELCGDGSMDARMRRILERNPLPGLTNALTDMLHFVSDRVEVTSYEHGDLLDFKTSMWWKINYRVPEYALPVDSGFEFKSPMMQMTTNVVGFFRPAAIEWPEKRHGDLFFYSTMMLDGHEVIKLPGNYQVVKPLTGGPVDETYAYFKGDSRMAKDALVIDQKIEVRRRQIPPDGYAGFRKAIKEAREYAGTVFRAAKGGAK